MKINVLTPNVYNRISAGEVVERPASIVKELVENSIDAGAKNIRIEIEGGGIKNITISDDGCGIDKEDITVAFLPHATSKIKEADDLDNIMSLGFRGEALASIAAVCQVKLSSKTAESVTGYSIKVDGGQFGQVCEIARSKGTTICCSNLFFNTPVRAKFLRKPKTEEAEITHLVERLMLSFSDIAFQYYVDGKQIYNTLSCSMSDIIYTIYGKEIYDNLVEVNYEEFRIKITGYVTKPKISKSNRTYQTLFVNNRYVENQLVSACVSNIYSTFLMKGRFPVYVLSLNVPPENVDVNVHPSKREVKFDNSNKIYGLVSRAIEKALLATDQIQNFLSAGYQDDIENLTIFVEEPRANGSNISSQSQKENAISAENNLRQEADKIQNTNAINNGHSFGKSFNENQNSEQYDLNDKVEVKEVEIENLGQNSNKSENEIDINQDLKALENMSIKDAYKDNKNKSVFFFDQSGEKFTRDIENETKSFLEASVKDEMKILGTIFKTYIAIEYDDAVYFIDQHAGHERLLYDKLVKTVNENNSAKQQLLAPYVFTVGAKESQSIDLLMPSLKNIGFEMTKNNFTYSITEVPYLLAYINLSKFVDEIVSESVNLEGKASDYIHSKLCQSACKHAIKAGDTISNDECAYIIEEVRKGVMLCPHGRPITLVITKREFEKMFKRIV